MTTTARISVLCLGLLGAARAGTLQFGFESPDSAQNPAALRAWWFPRKDAERRSSRHTCTVRRDSTSPLAGHWSAKVSFVLDGSPYPSAGIGFQFEQGSAVDLREMTALRLKLRTDRPRTLRVSLGSRLPAYEAANDTGVNLGLDVRVKDSTLDLTLPLERFAYPAWSSQEPAADRNAVLSLVTALQVTLSGQQGETLDSGWIRIDDLALEGIDATPPAPPAGRCDGEARLLSDFATPPEKRNTFGGWWYAYTDSSSDDSLARGSSLFQDTAGRWVASGWEPDRDRHLARAAFRLVRGGPYSGYGALETQFQPTAGQSVSLPGLHSIGFGLTVPEGFPDTLVSLAFHAKKAGSEYRNGRDHQVRLPATPGRTRWCLALDSLEQPDWVGLWKQPFTPDSLLTLSWEVRLASGASSATAGFSLDTVALYGTVPAGLHARAGIPGLRTERQGGCVVLRRAPGPALEVFLLDPAGRHLDRLAWAAGSTSLPLPASRGLRLAYLPSTGERLFLPVF